MGIFYKKLMEAAVEDGIQDPDNIGVDLDAIEDGIVGKDGIEAHRDEVEAAEEGIVGDPVEEAAFIMYESECNFNMLMKAIGVAELHEMAAGRDFILEAENKTGFFAKMAQLFKQMFARITELFKNVMMKLSSAFSNHKKFLKDNDPAIIRGFDGQWSFETYDMDALNIGYEDKNFVSETTNEKLTKAAIIKHVAMVDVADGDKCVGEMNDKLNEKIYVKKEYKNGAPNSLRDTVRDILNGNDDIQRVKAEYAKVKASYKEALQTLKSAEKEYTNKGKLMTDADKEAATEIITMISNLRFEKTIQDAMFGHVLKARKTRRDVALMMARKWAAADPEKRKDSKKGGKFLKPKSESTIFDFDII